MPCISGTFQPSIGILLDTKVFPCSSKPTTVPPPAHPGVAGKGLVDTGAAKTCIDSKLATTLALKPTGKARMHSAAGPAAVNEYLIDFELAFGGLVARVNTLCVVEFNGGNNTFQVLIGRDVLCQGVLTIDLSNHFTFSL